uniref:Uncharacterized protein n=1 Tax=Rhizophora mucronata TaxID=61149 RepID=A0A2P2P402_RHIMU
MQGGIKSNPLQQCKQIERHVQSHVELHSRP